MCVLAISTWRTVKVEADTRADDDLWREMGGMWKVGRREGGLQRRGQKSPSAIGETITTKERRRFETLDPRLGQ